MPPVRGAPLTLGSTIPEIDARLAARITRSGRVPAAEVLARAFEIHTVGDLLHHYPRRYIDRSRVDTISKVRIGEFITVIGRVTKVESRRARNRTTIVTITVEDGTGRIPLPFFGQPWIAKQYRAGTEIAVSGVATLYRGKLQLTRPEIEILRGPELDLVHTGRITPVHPATDGIASRTIRELVRRALDRLEPLADPVPFEVIEPEGLGSFDRALRDIHFPDDDAALDAAIERLKFDELFTLELGVAFRRHRVEAESTGVEHDPQPVLARRLLETLPFEPTRGQRTAIERIGKAMAAERPMNALLQGDVGSGKTLVAVHAALVAIGSGHQAAIMAPTEVLAGQHLRSVRQLLAGIGAASFLAVAPAEATPRIGIAGQASLLEGLGSGPDGAEPPEHALTYALLTGAVTGKDRERIVAGVAGGAVDLVVGTHALVQETVTFHDLSLAVIDEQHRFGLHQRTALSRKGSEPDVLVMTATPIPRTLALTYYGDLDVVLLDELPGGRRPITTRAVRNDGERGAAYALVREEVAAGRQAFVVCAAIEGANRAEVRAAEDEAERLATRVFPDLRIELLHGRMRPKEKDAIMERFRDGGADVLISTTVIEVGVDVPNATVMLVENAERFGLAQLHQLRGRIGRGEHASTCVLFDASGPDNLLARSRVDAMVRTTDGFELADEDLRLRGEGTLFDARQSGMPDLRLARLADDMELVVRARDRAFALIERDPALEDHPALLAELRQRFERSIDWLFTS